MQKISSKKLMNHTLFSLMQITAPLTTDLVMPAFKVPVVLPERSPGATAPSALAPTDSPAAGVIDPVPVSIVP